MRTVYACTLTFDVGDDINIWRHVTAWWEGSFRRSTGQETGVDWSVDEGSDGINSDPPLTSYCVHRRPGQLLREINGVVPDAYDISLLWNTHVSYAEDSEGAIFEIVLAMSAAEFTVVPATFKIGTPRIVRTLVGLGRSHVGVTKLSNAPHPLRRDDLQTFIALLRSGLRWFPLIVVSSDPVVGVPLIDPVDLAERLSGLGVVAVLDTDASFPLADALPPGFSCYNGAVRIYWPGLTMTERTFWPALSLTDNPRRHPLYLPWYIHQRSPERFVEEIARRIYGVAAYRYVEDHRIRLIRLEAERATLEDAKARSRQNQNFDELFEEYSKLDTKYSTAIDELDALRNENANLKANQTAIIAYGNPEGDDQGDEDDDEDGPRSGAATRFKTVRGAVDAAKKTFPHLVFLDDALDSASASPYKQPDKVHRVLTVLAEIAKEWAENGDVGSWRNAFEEKGFELKEHLSTSAATKWRADYEYVYESKKRIFGAHVTLGKGMSPAKCLSVHYWRDETRRLVVVGHVGRHKHNTKTS
jgi:hypothetical protein